MDRDREIDRRDRERDRDLDRRERFERRDELDRRMERDDRDRPADVWKRDQPPNRNENRIPSISAAPPVPPALHTGPATSDRVPDHPNVEQTRKPSIAEPRRDLERSERPDTTVPRPEPPKEFHTPIKRSPPPAAPQVPAFGSVTAPIPDLSAEKRLSDAGGAPPLAPKVEKEHHEPLSRGPIQPPTGPKASRTSPQQPLEQRIRRDETLDTSSKHEPVARTSKPHSVARVSAQRQPDLSPPTAPAAMTGKEPPAPQVETPLANKSGPIVSSPELSARGPPSANRGSSPGPHTSPLMHSSSIPTGPRALQQRPSVSRGPPKSNKQWVRPGYRGPLPAPNAIVTPKRDSIDGKERALSISEEPKREQRMSIDDSTSGPEAGEIIPGKEKQESKREASPVSPERSRPLNPRAPSPSLPPTEDVGPKEKITGDKTDVLIPDFSRTSDEDEDENVVFTQEYLEERKRTFEKDMRALRAELPPPPLEDPNIVALLMRIQLLGAIANDVTPERAPNPPLPANKMEAEDREEVVIPPEVKLDKDAEDQESSAKMVLDSLPPADAVTIESLPFLNSGPPTPLSDLDIYQENAAAHQSIKEVFRGEMMKRRKEIARKNLALQHDYVDLYKEWRLRVHELDRSKEKNSLTPGPVSPPGTAIATPTTAEGRRYKGNSELDFQNALRASEISAQEELERRRGNKATAQPDLSREAVIPDMLELDEAKARVYKDTNNIIDPDKAMDVFGFIPPPNDFSPEEHEIFTDAFMAHPKKWGKIAESLPGRDFRQCIIHYYLTKEEIKYKAKLNKRWSRRGRARRSARPKSNALMADLGVVKPDYEGEEEPAPVTDTGRPRRAAAPTFGDSSADTEHTSNGRRGAKDGDQPEKPASRRGRTGAGSRGGRRGKVAQQQQQQQQQQQLQPQQSQPQPQPQIGRAHV